MSVDDPQMRSLRRLLVTVRIMVVFAVLSLVFVILDVALDLT